MMYLVETIRYGNPELGVFVYGVFDNVELLHQTMKEYNLFRGGKYPAYYVTELGPVNPKDHSAGWRTLYKIEDS